MDNTRKQPSEGIIVKGVGGLYTVRTESGQEECRARGIFRKEDMTPLVGDRVIIDNGAICRILPRKNSLSRPLCANIDKLFIVAALSDPEPSALNIDKMTASALLCDIEPVLIFNKVDLGDRYGIRDIYRNVPLKQIDICAACPDENSVAALKSEICGYTVALSGASGVGKSSIVNLLENTSVAQTGDISRRLKRGRNTTRHTELFEFCGGWIIDTPGFSSFFPEYFKAEDINALPECFPEFREYIGRCRFADCAHIREPGCAVRQAAETGLISLSRYEGYIAVYEQVCGLDPWKK